MARIGPPPVTRDSEWEWDGEGPFNPRYDARVSAEGIAYGCEIQGPFGGYDSHGQQTWEEFFASGPPADIQMPPHVLAALQKLGLAQKPAAGG